ncbi:MAG: NAD(P)H-hydrate dehydratase [Actinomycetota bacterium]|nr:NAD(P)H-hydrate dehydratase [Actinomycetota bacterium]
MRHAHTVAVVRAAEEPLLAAGVPLMDRASTGLAVAVAHRLPAVYGARVVLLVGSGNNGADTLYAGAWLARRGAAVVAVLAADPVQHAVQDFLLAGGTVGMPQALVGAEVVVDGLVGIGGHGPLRPAAAELVAGIDGGMVVAVDVPTGIDADTGAVSPGALRADLTVTFGGLKPGLLLARQHVGELQLVDIGLALGPTDLEVLEDADVAARMPEPTGDDDKYTRGVLGVVAGSPSYPGAAVLTVGAALAAGAGMVRYVGARDEVRLRWPEAVVSADVGTTGRVQAWAVGPGLGLDALEVLVDVLEREEPVLLDADALTIVAEHPYLVQRRTGPTLVTPHEREFARFGTPVGDDRIGAARRLAAELGAHVLLKGDATVVAAPDGRVRLNPTGSPYLASAGSGDVLAGVVGALLAQGLDPLDAGSVGAYVHGLAGDLTRSSPSALIEAWPDVVRCLRD